MQRMSLIVAAAALAALSACSKQANDRDYEANNATDAMTTNHMMANGMMMNDMGNVAGNHGVSSGMPAPPTNTPEHAIMNEQDSHQH